MKMILASPLLSLVCGLAFGVPSGNTTDIPDLVCVQVDRGDRTYVVCTEERLDDDAVDVIIDHAEGVRKRLHEKKPAPKKGSL